MDIVQKLKAWATQISYRYLLSHDPGAIDMNTMSYAFQDLLTHEEEDMDIENEGELIPVPERGNARNQNRNNGSTQQVSTTTNETGISTAPGFNNPPEENISPTQIQTPPPSNHPLPIQVTPSPPSVADNRSTIPTQQYSLIKAPQPRPSPHVYTCLLPWAIYNVDPN
jgi:hypothetical protein